MPLIRLSPDDLVPLNLLAGSGALGVRVAYAETGAADGLAGPFRGLYHPDAKILWAHREMAVVILVAAEICRQAYGWRLEALDCFRPVEAQERMAAHGYHESLVAPPGKGGHPRGMAVDVRPMEAATGLYPDMGTPFDYFVADPALGNPAARTHTDFGGAERNRIVLDNRRKLERAFMLAGQAHGRPVLPLSSEWWDFRFLPDDFTRFAPLAEGDVHPCQRMIAPDGGAVNALLNGEMPDAMKALIENVRERAGAALARVIWPETP